MAVNVINSIMQLDIKVY